MARKNKGSRPGKKGGSVIDQPIDPAARKGKSKKQKKQSKGKQKR